jgi:ribosomal protein S6--L-glutamate ligase
VKSVNFFFMLARRTPDVPSQIILEVSKILRRRGHGIACSIVEESLASLHNLPLGHDLYLLKSYTELSLSLAGALDACGAHLINPYAGCVAARNKIVCYQILREAGVPVPKAWITSDPGLLKELVQECPLIVKPYMGWRGEGIQLVRNERERAALAPFNTPALIQEYVENDGEDLRLYVAGEEVFGIRKRFSSSSFAQDGEPVPASAEIRDIALRCGHAFGLRLYGIDIIEGRNGPKVVDVNYFPGYKGVPGAAGCVADCIESYGRSTAAVHGQAMLNVAQ